MDDTTLVKTICRLLAERGVGAWQPAGPAYTSGQVGIHYGALPPDPDRAIGVTLYATQDDIAGPPPMRYVQLRFRGARGAVDGADTLADAAFTALHATHHTAGLARARRVSSAHLGADESGRQERTDNYQIIPSHLSAPGGTP